MSRQLLLVFIAVALCVPMALKADNVDFHTSRDVLSFEEGTSPVVAGKKSRVSISDYHSKLGSHSLKWEWSGKGASLSIPAAVPYLKENPNPAETSVSSFVFWIYSPEALPGSVRFSFLKEGRECCHFDYRLGFTGWRGAWVAFDRDMEGTPEEGMDEVRITAPDEARKGSLYLDGVILSSFQDVRYHTPDWQAPYINKETTSHWLVLDKSWNTVLDIPQKPVLEESDIKDMDKVMERFVELVVSGKKPMGIEKLRSIYDSYGFGHNPDGTLRGKPIFFTRYGETFINLGIKDASRRFSDNGQLLMQINDNLFHMAVSWYRSRDVEERDAIASMYVDLTRLLLDQGFAAGSGQGTLHHLGYSMRNFYTAPVIMRDVLAEAGLLGEVQKAMEWFSGVGEVKAAPEVPGMDIDAFNTSLMGRVASLLVMDDTPYKYAYMQALSRWIDNGFRYTGGTMPCFKTDGTVFHHRKAYPAYATGGFDGAVNAVWMLSRTSFAVSRRGHEILKRALLEMRFYCNKASFPLAMSGRHPDGKGALIPRQYSLLADAGSPDGMEPIDRDLAAAYLRLNGAKGAWAKKFMDAGITAEAAPCGSRAYGYNSSLSHRQGEWLVTFAGHSRYLWATETYVGANHYGRYLTHGSMQILSDKEPDIDSFGSGYQVDGWDWCHIPGTTAADIPMEEMKANILNVDEYSGYEEMLLSDEWFAGGVTHKGVSGAYSMKLHEHDKYNGSLRARKSFFAFGDRIVALGSDLENSLEGSELHTTLFQETIGPDDVIFVNGEKVMENGFRGEYYGNTVIVNRLGNAYLVRDADVVVTRGVQHSLHEETDAPTQGCFEKAYICHGGIVGKDLTGTRDSYEYMVAVHPSEEELAGYVDVLPYSVVRCDSHVHHVVDRSGINACAVFEEADLEGTVCHSTPAMLMYSIDADGILTLSASNPDLALYEGASDEMFDEDGKRVERSVYGRTWIDNPCGQTYVTVTLDGAWEICGPVTADASLSYSGGKTMIELCTSEARTEEMTLSRKD
ncbi:MAG: sugar lyase [Bacteroidales bacterium]|nr:sugar lyase [Bacteroidales bacterium]